MKDFWSRGLCVPSSGEILDVDQQHLHEALCRYGTRSRTCALVSTTPDEQWQCLRANCPKTCRGSDDVVGCMSGCILADGTKKIEGSRRSGGGQGTKLLVPTKRYKPGASDCIHAYCNGEAGLDYYACIMAHCNR